MWGLRASQVVGRQFFTLPIGDVAQRAHQAFQDVLASGQSIEVPDVGYSRQGGQTARGTLRLLPLRDAAHATVGAFVLMLPAV